MQNIAAEHQSWIAELIVDRSLSASNIQLEVRREVQEIGRRAEGSAWTVFFGFQRCSDTSNKGFYIDKGNLKGVRYHAPGSPKYSLILYRLHDPF